MPASGALRSRSSLVQSQMRYGRDDQRTVQQEVDDFTAECRKVLHLAESGRPGASSLLEPLGTALTSALTPR